MFYALREFLNHLIDYAGMFPPASLSLDESIRRYAMYLKSADAWMLGRFVCFANQLAQLEPYTDLFDADAPLKISALGARNPTRENFFTELETTRDQLEVFNRKWGARGAVDAVEILLPQNFSEIRPVQYDAHVNHPALYVEIPFDVEWSTNLPPVLDVLAEQRVGFKLRTGGIISSAFPSSAQVAQAIIACRDRNVRIKCTAGLHHPLRRFDASVQTEMYGFVNVFGAGILAHVHSLDQKVVREFLEDDDAKNFCFDENGFAWRDVRARTEEIARARCETMISFGCCSFDEPRQDLSALGWL